MLAARANSSSYTFNFAPTKIPTVLALSATTCEQVAVSPEIAMGESGFWKQKRDITVPLALTNNNHTIQSFESYLNSFAVR